MRACIFVGPTLWRDPIPCQIARFGPAALGSVFRAVEAGYQRIGIIDGVFGDSPAVWHKEILYAISSGVEVIGGASMGALRAAELSRFGMSGVGTIYRMYHRGSWTDDDEVAVVHAPGELGYQPFSESMADIRLTLRRMTRGHVLDADAAAELVRGMKAVHFSERTECELRRRCIAALGTERGHSASELFHQLRVEAKRRDALALLGRIAAPRNPASVLAHGRFASTRHWRRQFVTRIADIPPLR